MLALKRIDEAEIAQRCADAEGAVHCFIDRQTLAQELLARNVIAFVFGQMREIVEG